MSNNYRELTGREKQRIKKLVISLCANYDKEYGCLPLDCDCPMSVSYTHLFSIHLAPKVVVLF